MEFILYIIYLYILIYTLYMFVLSVRNLKDKPFSIEKKYSRYDDIKNNFALIIYSHNHKECLQELIEQIKMQDYPLANFKVYAILDDCNDGSERLFEYDNFVHVMNIHDVGTLGKNKAIAMLNSISLFLSFTTLVTNAPIQKEIPATKVTNNAYKELI